VGYGHQCTLAAGAHTVSDDLPVGLIEVVDLAGSYGTGFQFRTTLRGLDAPIRVPQFAPEDRDGHHPFHEAAGRLRLLFRWENALTASLSWRPCDHDEIEIQLDSDNHD